MKNTRSLEIGTGLFVLLGFAALAFLTTQLPGSSLKLKSNGEGYAVNAAFDNIGDLKEGSPVTQLATVPGDASPAPSTASKKLPSSPSYESWRAWAAGSFSTSA